MPLKQDRTSFNVSNNLKTSMVANGNYVGLEEGRTYYDGSGAEIHLALYQLADGTYRTVANTATFTDIVAGNDPNFVRMWIEEELAIFIGRTPGVEGFTNTFNAGTSIWTCVITHNGTTENGTDTKKVDAMTKALVKVLNRP